MVSYLRQFEEKKIQEKLENFFLKNIGFQKTCFVRFVELSTLCQLQSSFGAKYKFLKYFLVPFAKFEKIGRHVLIKIQKKKISIYFKSLLYNCI